MSAILESISTPFRDPKAQLRLLSLHVSNEETVHGTLQTWDRSRNPHFFSISYVWGNPPLRKHIFVNGVQPSVTANCLYAVRQAHHHFPDVCVWIDSVCINQSDLGEKAAQISAMGEIYAIAAQVLACVGPPDACSQAICKAAEDTDAFLQELPPPWPNHEDLIE